jgi:membrane-bound ClpP family serine protease
VRNCLRDFFLSLVLVAVAPMAPVSQVGRAQSRVFSPFISTTVNLVTQEYVSSATRAEDEVSAMVLVLDTPGGPDPRCGDRKRFLASKVPVMFMSLLRFEC